MQESMKFGSMTLGFKKLKQRLSEDPDELVRDALESGFDGDYEDALEILDKGIYLFSSTLDNKEKKMNFWLLKARALVELERYGEALETVEKSIKIDKQDPNPLIIKAGIFHEMEKYEDSLKEYNKVTKLCDKELASELWYVKAHALSHLKKHVKSLELYEKSIKKDPKDFDSWLGKSEELFELGKTRESLNACEKGLEINQEDPGLIFQKGFLLSEFDKNEEALTYYDRLIQMDSSDEDAWFNKACVLSLMNKKEEALDALTVATALDPDNVIEMKDEKDFKNIKNSPRFNRLASQEV